MSEYLQDFLQSETTAYGESKKRKSDRKKILTCECTTPGADCIAFDTQGCLKCPQGDCAYYMPNFIVSAMPQRQNLRVRYAVMAPGLPQNSTMAKRLFCAPSSLPLPGCGFRVRKGSCDWIGVLILDGVAWFWTVST